MLPEGVGFPAAAPSKMGVPPKPAKENCAIFADASPSGLFGLLFVSPFAANGGPGAPVLANIPGVPNGVDFVAVLPNGDGPFPKVAIDAEADENATGFVPLRDGSLPLTLLKPLKRDGGLVVFAATRGTREGVTLCIPGGSPSGIPGGETEEDGANNLTAGD